MTEKQRRLTILDRAQIIEKLEAGEKEINLAKEYGVTQMTISQTKKKKENIISSKRTIIEQHGSLSKKKMTGIEDSALDKRLYRWFFQMRSLGNPVSGLVLQEKAMVFNNLFNGRKDFHASNGWLHKWKKRHQIRQLTIAGERLSADEEGSANFSIGFCKFIGDHHYSRDQIYNADETGLMWKSLPSKTLVATYEKKAPGRKVFKDRVTIMICSNVSGTHKIPLLVIGKVKKPRCFKNIKVLPVVYKAQRSGWMDRIIFKECTLTFFYPK